MLLLLLLLLANINVFASELPCADFQISVNSSDVQAYSRKDGTQFSEAFRKEHCKDVYPGTKEWSESFKDTPLQSWIYKENFKPWTKKEKETILKMIYLWPKEFKSWKNPELYRATKSQFPNNPGASLPIANAIIIYDNFFKFPNPHIVLSHELAHLYLFSSSPLKLKRILTATGWEWDLSNRPKWTSKNKPLKPDSIDSPSEDLANHIEDFLHSREKLKNDRPEVFKLLEDLLGTDFRLKDQK